jgi:hypothetical protein
MRHGDTQSVDCASGISNVGQHGRKGRKFSVPTDDKFCPLNTFVGLKITHETHRQKNSSTISCRCLK